MEVGQLKADVLAKRLQLPDPLEYGEQFDARTSHVSSAGCGVREAMSLLRVQALRFQLV